MEGSRSLGTIIGIYEVVVFYGSIVVFVWVCGLVAATARSWHHCSH